MPTKKRKYEARFPPARIKKIMQTDEEIGKVAAAVPVIISRSLEIFLQSLVETTAKYTTERKAKTMTKAHLKHCIESEKKFDFLQDLVANIADISTQEEEECGEAGERVKKTRKPRSTSERKRKKKETDDEDEESAQSSENEEEPAIPPMQPFLPPISAIASSVPSSTHRSSHSIDAIIGNTAINKPHNVNQPLPPDVTNPITFNSLQPNFSSFTPMASNTMAPMALPMSTTNDDEDDDYDT